MSVDRGGHAAVGPLHPSARERVRRRSQPHWRVWWQRRRAARAAARDDSRLRGSVGLRRGAQGIQSRRGGRGVLSAHGSRSMGDASSRPFQLATEAEAAQYSPIRFVSPGAAPSLIVHGDADHRRPDRRGGDDARGADESGRARVVHSHPGAGHGFEGPLTRARQCRNGAVVRAASWGRGEVEPYPPPTSPYLGRRRKRVSNVEKNLQNDVDFQQARSTFQ